MEGKVLMRCIWVVIFLIVAGCGRVVSDGCPVATGVRDGCESLRGGVAGEYLVVANRVLEERGVEINDLTLNLVEKCAWGVSVVYTRCQNGSSPSAFAVEVSLNRNYAKYIGPE